MTTTTEIWRTPIDKGIKYENYQVSNLGEILSLNYRNTRKPGLRSPKEDKDGYLRIGLQKNGKTDWIYVHRLVAQTFLPNPENKPCINHKIEGDEGRKLNIVYINEDGSINKEKSTIEWCTYEENNNYGTHNERSAKSRINGKKSKLVLQFSLTGEFIREWPSTAECERNGFDRSAVSRCCNGKQKTHKGFRFMYK